MTAFDMNVLIRIKNADHYQPKKIEEMDKRLYIRGKDKLLYIPENELVNTREIRKIYNK